MTEPAVTGGFVPRGTGVRVIPQQVTKGVTVLGTAFLAGAGAVTGAGHVPVVGSAVIAGAGLVTGAGSVAGTVVSGGAALAAAGAVTASPKSATGSPQPSINITTGARRRPAHAIWSGVTGPAVTRGTPTRFGR